MKLQKTSQKIENQQLNSNRSRKGQNQPQTSFKGGMDIFLNFLQTNQAIGATFTDAAFMCTPRTIVDFTRGPEAGTETARREFSSNINDASLGLYGALAASLLSIGFNNHYGMKADRIYADSDTMEILADIKSGKDLREGSNLREFMKNTLGETEVFNPNSNVANNGWGRIETAAQNNVIDRLEREIKDEIANPKPKAFFLTKEWWKQKRERSELRNYLQSELISSTGTEGDYKITRKILNPKTNEMETKISSVSVKEYVDNLHKVAKAFMNEGVESALKTDSRKFLSSFRNLKIGTAAMGLAICAGIGAATQPINMYLTRKKTGTTGFVGGGKKDDSTKFKMKKRLVAATAMLAALSTISLKPNKLIPRLQFKGFLPTIPQFKLVYGITIVSRLLSARNDNELREATIKDSLGFANWLILGGLVSKAAAIGLEELPKFKKAGFKLTKYNKEESGKMPRVLASTFLSRDETLHEALKKAGIKVIENGKALTFKEMLGKISQIASEAERKAVKSKLKWLGLVQIIGYAWTGLALGVAIPKLNIAITNSVEGKKKAQKVTK